MPDILSQKEIENLLRATGASEEEIRERLKDPGGLKHGIKTRVSKPVVTYDFKHPNRVTKDQVRTLENLHSNLARLLAASFSTLRRAVVETDIAFVDQTTYAEFIMSLSNPSCSYVFTIQPLGGPAIIDFQLPIAYSFIDRQFGGKGDKLGETKRTLTAIERGVMAKVIRRTMEDLETTWEALLKIRVSDAELETNPEFMQVAAPSDTVILIAFEVSSQGVSGLVNLCYPFFTLEPVMNLLNVQSWVYREKGPNEGERQKRLDQVKGIETEMKVTWGRGIVSAEDLADLRVGDTLILDTQAGDPGIVFVEDQPVFLARPGVNARGRHAVELLRAIPQTEVRRYV